MLKYATVTNHEGIVARHLTIWQIRVWCMVPRYAYGWKPWFKLAFRCPWLWFSWWCLGGVIGRRRFKLEHA